MKNLALALVLLSAPAFACTAFYKDEYISGMNKICIYDHLGSDFATTVKAYQLCPITVRASH